MNKKEAAYVEELLTRIALRWTSPVEPDVMPPSPGGGLVKGFAFVGALGMSPRVDVACSSSAGHALGRDDKITSQNPKRLYSTRLRALRALRYAVEERCARLLRDIDHQIEREEAEPRTGAQEGSDGNG